MFTGIVKGLGTIISIDDKPGLRSFVVELPSGYGAGLQRGASVAIDGACLTATEIEGDRVQFDAMQETIDKTLVGTYSVASHVNVERSFRAGDEVGGHIVSGHVTGMGEISAIETPTNNHVVTFRVPTEWMKYILPKGFVSLDGCSLTIVDTNRTKGTFTVWLIPETLTLTTFGMKHAGDRVNVELDPQTRAIVDTVENYLESQNK